MRINDSTPFDGVVTPGSRELLVAELFGPTVQGEGPSTGRRAVFVRLSRCNLACPGCDTPYTWDTRRYDLRAQTRRMSGADVADWATAQDTTLVVVTGGEPLLQQAALDPVLEHLVAHRRHVEVETNGTCVPTRRVVELVDRFNVSPKLARFGGPGITRGARIHPTALRLLSSSGKAVFKFVVSGPQELDEVSDIAEEFGLDEVWVMPEGTDHASVSAGLARLAEPAIARGFNLSTRLHVTIWGNQRGH